MLHFRVENNRQKCDFTHESGPIEFGRSASKTSERFVVEDQFVSRTHLQIEESPPGKIQLENLGSNKTTFSDGTVFEKGQRASLELPVRLTIGFTRIEISLGKSDSSRKGSLDTIVQSRLIHPDDTAKPLVGMGTSPPAEELTKWFETLICVHQAAAGTDQFYAETAKAVVELVGLDRGLVILFEKQQPQIVASHAVQAATSLHYSQTVLSQVVQNKRTYYENSLGQSVAASLANIEAVVASPIFDVANEVVGVVFGSRDVHAKSQQHGITPLEAQVVQLLASAVSVGLARVEKEAEAARTQVQLEQFASRELVGELKRNSDLLNARDRELTLLFADLRGFSSISERLGPRPHMNLPEM